MTTASNSTSAPPPPTRPTAAPVGEPTWDVARLFPEQGHWSVEECLELRGNRLVEFSAGILEVLTTPTQPHQLIVMYLYRMLFAFTSARRSGTPLVAPLRVRLWVAKFREPDVVFMLAEHAGRRGEEYWDGADLVMELVSGDDRRRDLETKRFEYARAGIPEYWIVDPQHSRITVLKLESDRYAVHGEFTPGQHTASALLPGFAVDVSAAFAAGDA